MTAEARQSDRAPDGHRRQAVGGLAAITIALMLGSSWTGATAQAQEAAYAPEEVKAAFLYHFGAFVEWPSGVEPRDEITIAVLGAPEVAAELQRIVPGREVQGRPVSVRELESIDDLASAQILFIGEGEAEGLSALLESVRGKPVLTVTEADGGLDHGSVINFALVDRRVRFEVSLPAAEEAGIQLSSRLLAVALRVEQSSGLQHRLDGVHASLGRRLADRS
ncbi:MAG: YfiR family protein [Gammaproteobacteria bacterium]